MTLRSLWGVPIGPSATLLLAFNGRIAGLSGMVKGAIALAANCGAAAAVSGVGWGATAQGQRSPPPLWVPPTP